jgi:cytochrome c1
MHKMKKLLTALLFAPLSRWPAALGIHLDKAPDVQGDKAALQSGARTFVNYCLNCHGASFVRYNRLTDLGLTEQQVKDNLMFTAVKIGEPMRVAARPDEQKLWFGAAPPDLTLVARARASEEGSGADWLYTYLRSFYVDEKRPTGWNNTLFAERRHAERPLAIAGPAGIEQGSPPRTGWHPASCRLPSTTSRSPIWWVSWSGCPSPMPVSARAARFRRAGLSRRSFRLAYPLKKAYWKDVK